MIDIRSLFLRDAALWLALFAIAAQVAAGFYPGLTPELQGEIGAFASALFGVITAVLVRGDRLPPAILGFVQSGLSLTLAFGLHLTPASQTAVMTGVAAIVAGFVRTQVTSQIPPKTPAVGVGVGVTERRVPIREQSLAEMLQPPRRGVPQPSARDWVQGGGAPQPEHKTYVGRNPPPSPGPRPTGTQLMPTVK